MPSPVNTNEHKPFPKPEGVYIPMQVLRADGYWEDVTRNRPDKYAPDGYAYVTKDFARATLWTTKCNCKPFNIDGCTWCQGREFICRVYGGGTIIRAEVVWPTKGGVYCVEHVTRMVPPLPPSPSPPPPVPPTAAALEDFKAFGLERELRWTREELCTAERERHDLPAAVGRMREERDIAEGKIRELREQYGAEIRRQGNEIRAKDLQMNELRLRLSNLSNYVRHMSGSHSPEND